ncbi:unnamed protein product [Peronospora belbahrii]|uniref:Uncharacterized protein n=1 Tax=Peronospora belbahrii TaxID=622444 RepID=A0AAU9KJ99_9STRA|nr:unnamed protein product [Peronospora belbahrii]
MWRYAAPYSWVKVVEACLSPPINGITTALVCGAGLIMGMTVLVETVTATCRMRAALDRCGAHTAVVYFRKHLHFPALEHVLQLGG